MKNFPRHKKKKKNYIKAKQKKASDLPIRKVHHLLKKDQADKSIKRKIVNFSFKTNIKKLTIKWKMILASLAVRWGKWKIVIKKREQDLQLVLFPLLLLFVIIILGILNTQLSQKIKEEEFYGTSVNTLLYPYPIIESAIAPDISAKAAIVVAADPQVTIFSKNPQLRFSMASTTKIMTALTAMDYFATDAVLTVKSSGVEGSGLGLTRGEQFTFNALLYAMLLPSANDAAQTIADNYPGGSEEFVKKMNEKAQSLHLSDTHFSDPTGLDDDGDYTTVVDMARLATHAIKNPLFAEVTATKYKTISNSSYTRQYVLTNLNKLLGTQGVTGIKTGTTEGAGEVLVTSTVKNNHTYIIVVMHSTNRFDDTQVLMNYIEDHVKYETQKSNN